MSISNVDHFRALTAVLQLALPDFHPSKGVGSLQRSPYFVGHANGASFAKSYTRIDLLRTDDCDCVVPTLFECSGSIMYRHAPQPDTPLGVLDCNPGAENDLVLSFRNWNLTLPNTGGRIVLFSW